MKKIKIFCTLGPSSLNKNFLNFAKKNKIDMVRLNMSHLSIDNLKKNIEFVKKHSNLKICIDTEGAQIRTKIGKKVDLIKNQKIRIFKNKQFHLYPEEVFEKLKRGDLLQVGFDGLILKIGKKVKNYFLAECIQNGSLEKNKGVHLSNRNIKLNFITKKDFEAIKVGKKFKIKNYALSFTNTVNDIINFSKLLKQERKIYKIETYQALKNFKLLRNKAEEFLIDRGDLSKEITIEKIPYTQRFLFKNTLQIKV